ncbi:MULTISPECIES: maleylpyruvate isomerase N-terminal domain-containing protein [unclassified Streptomyces]|uniref:maleylpyruvate isomerase N-terminal domain-containing protein n=1 Tax=unclassified Streptomyces TaxID=2593676 RepID=UPI002E29FEBB|nr:maleylpyruvate isomerase N-terminal domain-containing protein [Streptomyces sp. NBC_00190]
MENNREFPDLLRLIDERSTAFRAAVASAPSLDVQVPTCPEWTLLDLVQHLGGGDRFWAAIVGPRPADAPPAEAAAARAAVAAPREREALPTWSAESTQLLLSALREAGPDRGCWTWWGRSQSPQDSGGVARHRVQETAVHTYDDQRLAAQARRLRLPRRRGPLLARHGRRQWRTAHPSAHHRYGRGPGHGRRLCPGHGQ